MNIHNIESPQEEIEYKLQKKDKVIVGICSICGGKVARSIYLWGTYSRAYCTACGAIEHLSPLPIIPMTPLYPTGDELVSDSTAGDHPDVVKITSTVVR